MLAARVADNATRLDNIDQSGTRGVGVVQQQLMDLKGDVGSLMTRLDKHEKSHVTESRERLSGRRWLVGAIIAFAAILETPILYVAAHIHG